MSSRGASKKMSGREKESAVLEREDFDAEPRNLDCIESGLWLGMCICFTIEVDYSNSRMQEVEFI
jgi:hypothetical protein